MAREVRVDVSDLIREVRRYEKAIENVGSLNQQGAQMLSLVVEDEFDTQGRGRWEGLAESTKQSRRGGPPYRILQDTGDLVGSILPASGPDFFEVATDKPYARFHLEGTQFMPERDFFDVMLDEVVEDYGDLLLAEISR